MKKVIVTRDNYEEVMFNLLENLYSKEVSENILDQINADTFLSFEWHQWSKATFTESTEFYKNSEAEFIENLTKEEGKKKGVLFYLLPMSIAASVILVVCLSIFKTPTTNEVPLFVINKKMESGELQKKDSVVFNNRATKVESQKLLAVELYERLMPDTITQFEIENDSLKYENRIIVENSPVASPNESQRFKDTLELMIRDAQRPSKYKITIVESLADAVIPIHEVVNERRYSMADVLNKKDGITFSKFLHNSTSRIVNDKTTNKVTIEYIAADHSVLVLNLSN